MRNQEAEQMAEEHHQDAEVEEVRAPSQLALAQELRRVAFPRVLVAVEAREAAEQEHRQRDVRIDAEQELMQRMNASVIVSLLTRGSARRCGGLRHEAHHRGLRGFSGGRRECRRVRPFLVDRRFRRRGSTHLLQSIPGSCAMDSTAASTAA